MQIRPVLLIRGFLLVAVALGTFLSSPASAHGGDPVITVDQVHPGQGSTHYFVKMTWDDGDPIADGSLTATPIAPDGTEGELVVLETTGDGIFQGAVPMDGPGTWTVRFTTVEPPGSLETTQVVEGPATTEAPATTAAPETTAAPDTTAAPETTEAPADTDDEVATGTADEESDDDSSSALPLILGGIVLLAIAAAAIYAVTRRNPPTDGDDTTDGTDDADTGGDVSTDTPA
jgi:hypothetical protein